MSNRQLTLSQADNRLRLQLASLNKCLERNRGLWEPNGLPLASFQAGADVNLFKYRPDQARDREGQWVDEGGISHSRTPPPAHLASVLNGVARAKPGTAKIVAAEKAKAEFEKLAAEIKAREADYPPYAQAGLWGLAAGGLTLVRTALQSAGTPALVLVPVLLLEGLTALIASLKMLAAWNDPYGTQQLKYMRTELKRLKVKADKAAKAALSQRKPVGKLTPKQSRSSSNVVDLFKYRPDQPRAPAGDPGGGQWVTGGGAAATRPARRPQGPRARAKPELAPSTRGKPSRKPTAPRSLVREVPDNFRPPKILSKPTMAEKMDAVFLAERFMQGNREPLVHRQMQERLDSYLNRFEAKDDMLLYMPYDHGFDELVRGGGIANVENNFMASVSMESAAPQKDNDDLPDWVEPLFGGPNKEIVEIVVPKGTKVGPPYLYADQAVPKLVESGLDESTGFKAGAIEANQDLFMFPRNTRLRYNGKRQIKTPGLERTVMQFEVMPAKAKAPRKPRAAAEDIRQWQERSGMNHRTPW